MVVGGATTFPVNPVIVPAAALADRGRGRYSNGFMTAITGDDGIGLRPSRSQISSLAPLLGQEVLVLHAPASAETEQDLSGLDVDCAVAGLDRRWPLRLSDGWRLCQALHYDLKGWYWVIERSGEVLCFDTIEDPQGLGRDGFPTALFTEGGTLRPSPGVQAAYLTAKRIRKGDLSAREWERIGMLARGDLDRYSKALDAVVGTKLARSLVGTAVHGRPPDLAALRWLRRRQLVRRYRTPARAITALALGARRELERVLDPTGLLVLVAGPDGAGKSTLADALPDLCRGMFRRGTRQHWRPGLLPRPGAFLGRELADPTRPHARPPHGRALSTALLVYYWFDFLLGGWLRTVPFRMRTGLVVLERGWWDLAVDPRRYRLDVPPRLVRAMGALLPRPDLALVLESEPALLRERKPELPEAELRRQATAWQAVLPQRVRRQHLDASRPLHEVAGEARERVLDLLETRAVARLGGGWTDLLGRTSRRVIPRRSRRQAHAALAIHYPLALPSRGAWEVARLLARCGSLRIVPRGEGPPRAVRQVLAQHLSPDGALATARVPDPDGGRHVALVLDEHGSCTGVAKVATNSEAERELEREATAIEAFGKLLPPPLSVPRILAYEPRLLLLEPVPWRARVRPWVLDEEVAGALGVFFRARADLSRAPRLGLAHGNLAPWNLLQTDNGWTLIDWEHAQDDQPPFIDLCHYLVLAHARLRRPSRRTLIEGFVDGRGWVGRAVRAYAQGAQLPATDAGRVLRWHLETMEVRLPPPNPDERTVSRARHRLLEQLEP
jgi:hypothetical protein